MSSHLTHNLKFYKNFIEVKIYTTNYSTRTHNISDYCETKNYSCVKYFQLLLPILVLIISCLLLSDFLVPIQLKLRYNNNLYSYWSLYDNFKTCMRYIMDACRIWWKLKTNRLATFKTYKMLVICTYV